MQDEKIADNILTAYTALIHSLPQEKQNIKSIYLKLTMSQSVEITDKGPVIHEKEVKEEPKETSKKEEKPKKEAKEEEKPEENK
jgi:hypothetical protein